MKRLLSVRVGFLASVLVAAVTAIAIHSFSAGSAQATNLRTDTGVYPGQAAGFFQQLAVAFPFQLRPLYSTPLASTDEVRITSLTFDNINDGDQFMRIGSLPATGKTCDGTSFADLHEVLVVDVPAHNTLHLPFPQPLTVSRTDSPWCLEVFQGSDVSLVNDAHLVRVTTIGYLA